MLPRLLILVFCTIPLFSLGQINSSRFRLDSLLKELPKTKDDSARRKLLNNVGTSYLNIDKDSAIRFTQEALNLAKENANDKNLGNAYHFMGYVYNKTSNYGLSMTNFDTAIQLYTKAGYKLGIAEALSVYGLSAWRIGQYDKSIKAYNRILSFEDKDEFKRPKLAALINTALIYEEQDRNEKAEETYKKALIQAKKIEDKYGEMIICNNLSSIYRFASDFKKSFPLSHQAIELAKELNSSNELARAYGNLGASLTKAGIYDSAEHYLKKGYQINKKTKDAPKQIKNTWHLAELYLKKGNIKKARQYGNESLKLSKENEILEDLAYGFEMMYDIELASGNKVRAAEMADSLLFWKDSLYKANNQKELANAESAYNNQILLKDNQLKTSEIKRLAATRNLFVVAFLLLLLSLFALWMFYKRKRAQQELENELNHNLRLTESIEAYRKRRATELHDDVGQDLLLARQSLQLNNTTDQTRDFIERALNKVRKISKDEFPYELSYVGLKTSLEYLIDLVEQNSEILISEELYELPNEIPAEQSLNVYRIIQEMINNSIKNPTTSAVFIGMQIQEDLLEITFKDNGQGFDFQSSLEQSKSIGLKSIVNRVRLLKGELKNVPSKTDNRYVIHVPF